MIHFPVNSIKEEGGIIPVSVGRDSCSPEQNYDFEKLSHYTIHFCLSGYGTFRVGDVSYNIGPGQAFIMCPGDVCNISSNPSDPWTYSWINFRGERAEVLRGVSRVTTTPADIGIQLCDFVMAGECSADIYISLLYLFIYHIHTQSAVHYDRVSEVRKFIKYKNTCGMSANDIAQRFNFSRDNLHRLFKARYGISVKAYMTQIRMNRARKLIESGNSVSETAYMVGYNSEFNFSQAFKKYFGVSPKSLKPPKSERPRYD